MMKQSKPAGFRKKGMQKRVLDVPFSYKTPESLQPFLTPRGTIIPARVSRLSHKQQRQLTTEVKRARQMGFLPYTTQLKSRD